MNGPLSGFLTAVWQVLIGPRTLLVLALWLAIGAALGLAAGPGEHPAEGALIHIPAVLLPFALAARADALLVRLLGGALSVALIGSLLAGGAPGRLVVAPGTETEAYERPSISRPVPTHLGGIVRLMADDDQHVALTLGAGTVEFGTARVSLVDGRESQLGAWQVRYRGGVPGSTANLARVRAVAAGQSPQSLTLRLRESATLPGGATVTLVELASDYGQGLGPAARLEIAEGDRQRTDWIFVDAPDLDARLGQGQWRFELSGVDAAPALELDVHRSGNPWTAAAGWGLVSVLLLALATRRTQELA